MFPEEVLDLVQIPKPPPSRPKLYYYQPSELREEIRGDMRRQLDATEWKIVSGLLKCDMILSLGMYQFWGLLFVLRFFGKGGRVGVQGSCIMAILASKGIQIPPAHVEMAHAPIVATSTS